MRSDSCHGAQHPSRTRFRAPNHERVGATLVRMEEEKFQREDGVRRQGGTSGPSGGEGKEAGPVQEDRRQIAGTGTFSGGRKTKSSSRAPTSPGLCVSDWEMWDDENELII
jgi:hypothetical protein